MNTPLAPSLENPSALKENDPGQDLTPPRPSCSVLAQTSRFLKDPLPLLREAYEECGDVFSLRLLGMGEWVFVCSPETVKEVFKAPADVLDAGGIHRQMFGDIFGYDSTFNLDGRAHRERQKMVFPLLNGPEILQYVPIIHEETARAVDRWPRNQTFSLLAQTHHISLRVLSQAMFGQESPETIKRLVTQFEHFAETGPRSPLVRMPLLQVDLGRFSPWGKIVRLREETRGIFREVIQQRKAEIAAGKPQQDIMGKLLSAEQSDGTRLSTESALDEILTLLFAGHETTGTALTWIVERVLSHPAVLEKLLDEVDSVLGSRPITSGDLRQLKYLDAVVNESHRCRAIAPMAAIRVTEKPFPVGDYVVPQGCVVAECLYIMSLRDDLYSDPGSFLPERFLSQKPQRYEWTPFGGGRRACAGKGLAHLELVAITATLLQRMKLRLASSTNRAVREGHMFIPEHGLRIQAEKRTA